MNILGMKQGLTARQLQMVDSEFAEKKKDRTVMVLLWLFFAGLGAHRFYLGDKGLGIAMLLLGWATFLIWPIIDIFFAWKRVETKNEEIQERIINQVKLYDHPNLNAGTIRTEHISDKEI